MSCPTCGREGCSGDCDWSGPPETGGSKCGWCGQLRPCNCVGDDDDDDDDE